MKNTVARFETQPTNEREEVDRPCEPYSAMEKLKTKILELIQFGEDNQNVHRYVKKIAKEIDGLVEIAKSEFLHEKALRA